ncbi:coiled-coil domain-containing protein 102A-like [Pleurodeles waltl]
MSIKSCHRDTQRSGRSKQPPCLSGLDTVRSSGQPSSSLPESPIPRDHERCRRELAEAKLLATNMEKTLHWWAECASKWKERWARANAERHRAKKEARGLKQQVADLTQEVQELRKELESLKDQGTPVAEEGKDRDTSVQTKDITLGALEAEVREVLIKLQNWRASGEAERETGRSPKEGVETTPAAFETES